VTIFTLPSISARGGFSAGAFAAACSLMLVACPAWADYKISAGDVLGFSVAGLPELATKAPVDVDGNATLPLIGPLSVAGLSAPQALAKVQGVLPSKEFRRRTADGREFPVIISPGEIGLTVSEYRPVYLSGDVAKPGEEPFRPGLTVRKAIALAGGFDILRFKMDNPFLQLSDLTSDYNTSWVDFAKQQAVIARLQAELDAKQQLDAKLVITTPIAASLAKEILDNERNQLSVRNADFAKEQVYLRDAVLKEGDRAKVLNEQQSKEQDGVKADLADLQRYIELYNRGAVALPGLSDARRTVLLSSTRALQTTALLDSVEREQQDLNRKLDRVGDSRRMQLLQEMQVATTALASTRAKLQALSDKLRYTGMVKSQLVRGVDSQPKIVIMRVVDGRQSKINADIDAELQPGDTVEVALQAEQPVAVLR
jgi:polysaccharide export outer membrane protein